MNANLILTLDAIAEEAEKLLKLEMPEAVEARIRLILSMAHRHLDIQTEQETRR